MGTEEQQSGVSRRDLMKKGAVAGGIAWTAPILLSANDVAGAQTGGGSPPPSGACTEWFLGKYDTGDDPSPSNIHTDCQPSTGTHSCVPARSYSSACNTVISAAGNTVKLHQYLNKDVAGGRAISNVAGWTRGGKPGPDDCRAATNVTQDADGNWVITFATRTGAGGFSNIQFIFCA